MAATLLLAISGNPSWRSRCMDNQIPTAAVINIVAQSGSPVQAQQIAARTTTVFLAELSGNGVVVPSVYAQPAVPTSF